MAFEEAVGTYTGFIPQGGKMVDDARFRLVALFACWSYDDWLDLSMAQRGMVLRGAVPAGKAGPSDWGIILAARFDESPPERQVTAALDAANAGVMDCDGHTALQSFKVVGEAEWRQLAGDRATEVDALPDGHPHRLVASYGSLGAATSALAAADPLADAGPHRCQQALMVGRGTGCSS